jgi:sulfatase modifying factor 1
MRARPRSVAGAGRFALACAIGACDTTGSLAPSSDDASVDAGSTADGSDDGAINIACFGGDCRGSTPACCATVNLLGGVGTACQPLPCLGGTIPIQLCATTAECLAGDTCVAVGGSLKICMSGVDGGGADGAPICEAGSDGPSCGPGCGESCSTSLSVSGGTFYRTYTNSGDGGTAVANPATVSGFRLDKYDVTVGRFRQFVNAVLPPDGGAGWLPTAGSGKHTQLNGGLGLVNVGAQADGGPVHETGWVTSDNGNIAPTNTNLVCDPSYHTWTSAAGAYETLPINCVNWYEAYAFCIWDGGFLPSEAEWEYAAAGGSQQREYPWGSTPPGSANQYAIYNCDYPNGSGSCTDVANIAPVGTTGGGVGLWGQLDLAGNIWQWNLDWNAMYVDPCTDCAYVTATSARVFRGGSFSSSAPSLLAAYRGSGPPAIRLIYFGVRCARAP